MDEQETSAANYYQMDKTEQLTADAKKILSAGSKQWQKGRMTDKEYQEVCNKAEAMLDVASVIRAKFRKDRSL